MKSRHQSSVPRPSYPILPKVEIVEWIQRYFAVPARYRMYSCKRIANMAGYSIRLLNLINNRNYPISEEIQMNLSRLIHTVGIPRQRETERPNDISQVPDEVMIEFAQAVASLKWNEAQKEYGLDPNTIKVCKCGGVPNFYKKTLRRLYPELVGKPFEW